MLVKTRAKKPGIEIDGDLIVVRVRSPPKGFRANEEAREIIAEHFGVSRGKVRLISGLTSREKVFEVDL